MHAISEIFCAIMETGTSQPKRKNNKIQTSWKNNTGTWNSQKKITLYPVFP